MIMQIITNTPTWVFVIFAIVVARGVSAMRTRPVQMPMLIGLALAFLIFGAQGALTRGGDTPWPMLTWLLAVALGAAAGYLSVSRSMVFGERSSAQQRGSVVPLLLILLIFGSRYAAGVLNAMHPELLEPLVMRVLLGALYGVLTGILAGRTLRVCLLVRDLPGASSARAVAA